MGLAWAARVRCLAAALAVGAAVLPVSGCAGRPPQQRDRLVVGYPSGPTSLLSYEASDEVTASVLRNAYEPLVELAEDQALRPCLAESWHNPDDLTWVFKLRAGVVFHDGHALGASDVVESLRRANEAGSSRRSLRDIIAAIEAPDPSSVLIRTRRPYGWLPSYLRSWLVARPAGPSGIPPGTGRYLVREWRPGGDTVLEAFPGHRDGAPAIRALEFRAIPDAQERVRGLRRGELQLLPDVPVQELSELAGEPGLKTASRDGLRVVFLGLNTLGRGQGTTPGPLADRRVRQAIAAAIDRPALVARSLAGQGEPIDELVPAEVFGHHGRLAPTEFRPEVARRLLREAGHAAGLRLSLDFVPGRYPSIDRVAAALVADLRAVGIEIELRPSDIASFRERVAERKDTDLFLLGWLSATGDSAATFEALVHTRGRGGLGLYSGYSNPELDALLRETALPLSVLDRRARLIEVAEIVRRDRPVVPLYRLRDLYAFSDRLEFRPRLDRRIRGFDLRWR